MRWYGTARVPEAITTGASPYTTIPFFAAMMVKININSSYAGVR